MMESTLRVYLCALVAAMSVISTVTNEAGVYMVEDNCSLVNTGDWNNTGISYYCGNLTGLLSIVSKCPSTEEEWNVTSIEEDCQNGTQYHCLIDNFGKLRQGCLHLEWYKASHCPFYSIETEELKWIECGVCPQTIYRYDIIYKYQECVTPIEVVHPNSGNGTVTAVIILSVFVLIIIIVAIVGVRRRQIKDSVFVASISDRLSRARQRRNDAARRIKESKDKHKASHEEIV